MTPVLRVRGLVRRHGSEAVLDGVDLDVAEGRLVALLGAPGTAGSTLLRCVDLLEEVDGGQILLDGAEITGPAAFARAARRRMALVQAEPGLVPHLTVLQNVALGPYLIHRLRSEAAATRARDALERVELGGRGRLYPHRLTPGEQQRVALARALAVRPRLLLLDEITARLHPEPAGEVLAIVAELAHGPWTVLMATHETAFTRRSADRVAFLDQGRVHESGPPAQVLGDPARDRTRQFVARAVAAGRLS